MSRTDDDLVDHIDGRWVRAGDVTVSSRDLGLLRGIAVFEWLRVTEGVPLHVDLHLDRLAQSAGSLFLELPVPLAEVADIIDEGIRRNRLDEGGVRILLTAGDSVDSITPTGTARLAVLFTLRDRRTELLAAPCRLATVPLPRSFPDVKTTSYISAHLALRQVRGAGFDDALLVDRAIAPDGRVLEATRANFFGVLDGGLVTAGRDVLPGITRLSVIQVAHDAGVAVEERDILEHELPRLAAAFLTRSDLGIVPVRCIDALVLPEDPDPVVLAVADAYRRSIAAYVDRCASAVSGLAGGAP